MSPAADPIERMTATVVRGIVRWAPPKIEADPRPRPRAPRRAAIKPLPTPTRTRVNVVPCSCGCLLAHVDELCPSCGIKWAERDAVKASWAGQWWAA